MDDICNLKEGGKERRGRGYVDSVFFFLSLLSLLSVRVVVVVDWWSLSFLDGDDERKKRMNEERCQREGDEGSEVKKGGERRKDKHPKRGKLEWVVTKKSYCCWLLLLLFN